jgi:uncharacterized protein YhbP (UPF0306 family)
MLSSHKVLTLAYHDEEGPGGCALWYAHDKKMNLYFLSSLSTRHGSSIRSNPLVAFTIHKDDQDWQSITGIQGRGIVELCTDDQKPWKIYTKKFPFVLQRFDDLKSALEMTRLWKIIPTWIRRIDNRVSFGYKEEMVIERLER